MPNTPLHHVVIIGGGLEGSMRRRRCGGRQCASRSSIGAISTFSTLAVSGGDRGSIGGVIPTTALDLQHEPHFGHHGRGHRH